ncbi:GroES-like protein [Clavulina sp. PMI_390]|nr:GroES-like protein [Clavulina sp. PMI_390]
MTTHLIPVGVNGLEGYMARLPWTVLKSMPLGLPEEPISLVLGCDMAGEVLSVGPSVKKFAVGDRIVTPGKLGDENHGAFQQYAIVSEYAAAKLPDAISFDAAATMPLTWNTAVSGMFFDTGITAPWEGGRRKEAGNAIIIPGGSTSVGQFGEELFICRTHSVVHIPRFPGIQLAKLAGFSTIIATSSPQHAEFLQSIGATHVVAHTATAAEYTSLAAAHPITAAFLAIVTEEYITTALEVLPANTGRLMISGPQLAAVAFKLSAAHGIKPTIMFASVQEPSGQVFMAQAASALQGWLADGSVVPNRVQLVEGGLAGIPQAMDMLLGKMVSGYKLVARPFETA